MSRATRRVLALAFFLGAGAGRAHATPPNDDCSGATPITTSPFSDPVDLASATTSPEDTSSCGCNPNGHSVWYSFVAPPVGVRVQFHVYASTGFDPVIDAFDGACGASTPVTCQVGTGGFTAYGSFLACGGHSYLIELSAECTNVVSGSVTFYATTSSADPDNDGVDDCTDNCPLVANPGQQDTDGDGLGDACDPCPTIPAAEDADNDCVPDASDNCPARYNPTQADFNADGVGDACEDSDGDGILDASDNCPTVPNPAQTDIDNDGLGDACDTCVDFDHDGFGRGACPPDNCPYVFNPDQTDSNGDGIGDACSVVCGILGEAAEWSIIAPGSVSMKEGSGYHEQAEVRGSICAGTVSVQNVYLRGNYGSDIVALASAGTAVRLRPSPTSCLYCSGENDLFGAVITGGGAVKDPAGAGGSPDTSGTSPRVADCQRALAAARDASMRLAALPPTQVYGDVSIGIGEKFTIDARGGAVIQMSSLRMKGSSHFILEDTDPVVKVCDSGSPDAVATLEVLSNEGDQVLINVPTLALGTCAQPDLKNAVINVPGPGGSISIGTQVNYAYSSSPVLLAPERKVKMHGSPSDVPPVFGALYVKSLKTSGNVLVEDQWVDDLPCHPYP